MGTSLFELYLVLRKFAKLGEALCPSETDFVTYTSYEWFTPGVMHWLDISVYKAMSRIEKAIDLDKLVPIDETVKYSSSAVDTLAIFNQIKIFWEQLGWPDIEGSYALIARIIDVSFCLPKCLIKYTRSFRNGLLLSKTPSARKETKDHYFLASHGLKRK